MPIKRTIYIFIFSFLFPILVYLAIGIYFDEWETIASSFISFEYTTAMHYDWNPNVWFLIAPILSKLSYACNFSIFSLCYLLLISLNLFLSLYLISLLLEEKPFEELFFIFFITLCILFPLIFYVSNRSIVIWQCFNAVFIWYSYQKHHQKNNKFYAFLLMFLAIMIRFDLVLLFSVHLILYALIFNKNLVKLGAYVLIFSLSFFILFELSSYYFFKEYYYIERAERILFDKGFLFNAIEEYNLKNMAISLYVSDKEVFTDAVYTSIVKEFNMADYLLSKKIIHSFWRNTTSFIADLDRFRFFLLSFFLIALFLKRELLNVSKYALFIFLQICIILLMLVFFQVPGIYWFSIIVSFFLIYILSVSNKIFKNRYMVSTLLILGLSLFLAQNIKKQKIHHEEVCTYRDTMKQFEIRNIDIVFSFYPQNFQNLPSDIFYYDKNPKIEHHYLDALFFSKYTFLTNEHNIYFNNSYDSLSKKLAICEEKEVALFIEANYTQFLTNYLKEFHNINLSLVEFDFVNYELLEQSSISSKPYKIILD